MQTIVNFALIACCCRQLQCPLSSFSSTPGYMDDCVEVENASAETCNILNFCPTPHEFHDDFLCERLFETRNQLEQITIDKVYFTSIEVWQLESLMTKMQSFSETITDSVPNYRILIDAMNATGKPRLEAIASEVSDGKDEDQLMILWQPVVVIAVEGLLLGQFVYIIIKIGQLVSRWLTRKISTLNYKLIVMSVYILVTEVADWAKYHKVSRTLIHLSYAVILLPMIASIPSFSLTVADFLRSYWTLRYIFIPLRNVSNIVQNMAISMKTYLEVRVDVHQSTNLNNNSLFAIMCYQGTLKWITTLEINAKRSAIISRIALNHPQFRLSSLISIPTDGLVNHVAPDVMQVENGAQLNDLGEDVYLNRKQSNDAVGRNAVTSVEDAEYTIEQGDQFIQVQIEQHKPPEKVIDDLELHTMHMHMHETDMAQSISHLDLDAHVDQFNIDDGVNDESKFATHMHETEAVNDLEFDTHGGEPDMEVRELGEVLTDQVTQLNDSRRFAIDWRQHFQEVVAEGSRQLKNKNYSSAENVYTMAVENRDLLRRHLQLCGIAINMIPNGKDCPFFDILRRYIYLVCIKEEGYSNNRQTLQCMFGTGRLKQGSNSVTVNYPGNNPTPILGKSALKAKFTKLAKFCGIHSPDARCHASTCSKHGHRFAEIYLDLINFESYVSAKCSNGCNCEYHRECWKTILKRHNVSDEKQIDTMKCVTTTCNGVLTEVVIHYVGKPKEKISLKRSKLNEVGSKAPSKSSPKQLIQRENKMDKNEPRIEPKRYVTTLPEILQREPAAVSNQFDVLDSDKTKGKPRRKENDIQTAIHEIIELSKKKISNSESNHRWLNYETERIDYEINSNVKSTHIEVERTQLHHTDYSSTAHMQRTSLEKKSIEQLSDIDSVSGSPIGAKQGSCTQSEQIRQNVEVEVKIVKSIVSIEISTTCAEEGRPPPFCKRSDVNEDTEPEFNDHELMEYDSDSNFDSRQTIDYGERDFFDYFLELEEKIQNGHDH